MKKLLTTSLMLATLSGSTVQADIAGKVLVVLSGVDYVSLQGGATHRTGYFLPELAAPLKALLNQGYDVTFANPNGSEAVMDVVSDHPQWFKSEADYLEARALVMSMDGIRAPRTLSSFSEQELATYDGVFLPGGHAPMEDLYKDAELGRILRHFHEHSKPTALICHAPIALLAAQSADEPWIYSGYEMTVFSNAEEKQEEDAGHLEGLLLYYVADALQEAGAHVKVGPKWTSHVVRDRELITGQNPMSDHAFADALLNALKERQ